MSMRPPMTEQRAKEILGKRIQDEDGLYDGLEYLSWGPAWEKATLDGEFSADELEAIAWWMHNKIDMEAVAKVKDRLNKG